LAHHAVQPVPLTTAQRWGAIAALVALAILSAWPGVFNGFTYDDRYIVYENRALHDLGNWWRFFGMSYWPPSLSGEGYRPLTILLLAIEWAVGHGKPLVFHLVNIGLYAVVSVGVFCLAETCLPFAAAWIAAALFAVHPVHVEAVANVVGQAELLAALFTISALYLYVTKRRSNSLGGVGSAAIVLLYAAACLSKEHGAMLPALLLAAEFTIIQDATPMRARLVALRPLALGLCLVATGFLGAHLRATTQGITGFQPYAPFTMLGVGTSGRILTMFGAVPEWLRLLIWPLRLSPEYGPPANPVVPDFQLYQLPGMIIVAAAFTLAVVSRRTIPALSFGIWFIAITLLPVSNFLFPAAGFISERTLFSPSIGLVISLGAAVPVIYQRLTQRRAEIAIASVLALVLALGAAHSMNRTRVWKDNQTLFERAVIDMPNVYRSHFMLGSLRVDQGRAVEAEREFAAAMSLYDKDPAVPFTLGEVYRTAGLYAPAVTMYQDALKIDSTRYETRARLALSLAELGRWPDADREARRTLVHNTRSPMPMLNIIRLAHAATKFPVVLQSHPHVPASSSPR
jgi:protein O-mannosyl-transferase